MFRIQRVGRLPHSILSQRNFSEKVTVTHIARAKAETTEPETIPETANFLETPAVKEFPAFDSEAPKSYAEFMKLPQLDSKWYTDISNMVDSSKESMQGIMDSKVMTEQFSKVMDSSKSALQGVTSMDSKVMTEQFSKVMDSSKESMQGIIDPKVMTEQFSKVMDSSKESMQGIMDPKVMTEQFSKVMDSSKSALQGMTSMDSKVMTEQFDSMGARGPLILAAVAGSGLLLWSKSTKSKSKITDSVADLHNVVPEFAAFEKYPMSQYMLIPDSELETASDTEASATSIRAAPQMARLSEKAPVLPKNSVKTVARLSSEKASVLIDDTIDSVIPVTRR